MLTKNSVDPIIDNCDSNKWDPLVVFAHFLTSGQQSNISIDRWDNLTVIKLFSAAMKCSKRTERQRMRTESLTITIYQAAQIKFEEYIPHNEKRFLIIISTVDIKYQSLLSRTLPDDVDDVDIDDVRIIS